MQLPETKYLIAAAVVVMLIFMYFMYKRKSAEKTTDKKGKRTKKKEKPKSKSRSRKLARPKDDDDEPDDQEPEEADQDAAQELYNLVHDRMASGMQSDEFIETVGDDYDNLTYIEIKQLYNDAKNHGQDGSRSVTIDDYASVLGKRSDSE